MARVIKQISYFVTAIALIAILCQVSPTVRHQIIAADAGASTVSADPLTPTAVASGLGFVPVRPKRLLDTREHGGVVTPAAPVLVCDPDLNFQNMGFEVNALALVITVTQPDAAGFITVYPNNQVKPPTSDVNFVAGQTISGFLITPAYRGCVRIASYVTLHLIVDIKGYYV